MWIHFKKDSYTTVLTDSHFNSVALVVTPTSSVLVKN